MRWRNGLNSPAGGQCIALAIMGAALLWAAASGAAIDAPQTAAVDPTVAVGAAGGSVTDDTAAGGIAALATVAVDAAAGSVTDAHTLDWPVGECFPYPLDSGPVANADRGYATAFQDTVTVASAAWLRLYFGQTDLPTGSFLRLTSAYDGEVQELDADGLAMWGNSSAYFNGDTVYLELVGGPGTSANRVVLERVAAQLIARERGVCGSDCGICGTDDRVPSAEVWTGRLMPVGCTASIWNPESCLVSAGHCAGSNLVIQFNVPASGSSCQVNNPPVADQFPVTGYLNQVAGVGADWSVMTTGTNSLGQKAYERYGVLRPISGSVGVAGDPITFYGYGLDSDNPTRSQTQQFSAGPIAEQGSTYYGFIADVAAGASGSALLLNNEIIGIVTHCTPDCPNYATRIDLPVFVSAREQLCPDGTPPTPDPMTFAVAPAPQSATAVTMTATAATDTASPPVEYHFEFVSGGGGGTDSGWVLSRAYTDSGLTPNTSYTYRVRARDSAPTPNVTAYSADASTVTGIETPTGIAFGAVGEGAIELNALGTFTNLTQDLSGLFFDSTTPGGDGGINVWVQATSATATGLSLDTLYTFQVKARNRNAVETPFSSAASKATLAAVPAAPILVNPTPNTMVVYLNPNGNPSHTVFAIRCTASSPLDAAWDGQYAGAGGQPGVAATWLTAAQWGYTTLTQMQPSTTYTLAVKARNVEGVETALGPGASLATVAPYVTGDMNCDGVVDFDDISPFVTALVGQAAYKARYPTCRWLNADCNHDGLVDFDDINPFVKCLINQGCP